jgi:hypothetical protein
MIAAGLDPSHFYLYESISEGIVEERIVECASRIKALLWNRRGR